MVLKKFVGYFTFLDFDFVLGDNSALHLTEVLQFLPTVIGIKANLLMVAELS